MILKPSIFTKLMRGHPLARGLVGCWLFNEGSGGQVFDLSGNNHPGTFVNTPTWVPGKFGPAIDFVDTDSDYIDVLNLPEGFITPPCTVIVWLKCDVLPSVRGDEYTLFRYATLAHNTERYQIRIEDSGANTNKLLATVSVNGETSDAFGPSAIIAGRWHQAVFVSESSTVHKIYMDAVVGGTATAAFPAITTPKLQFGVNYYDVLRDYIWGQIDIPSVYNRALCVSEIALLYREPFCMFERDPIELWAAATQGGKAPTVKPMWYYQEMMRRTG